MHKSTKAQNSHAQRNHANKVKFLIDGRKKTDSYRSMFAGRMRHALVRLSSIKIFELIIYLPFIVAKTFE